VKNLIFFLCPNQMNQISICREKIYEFWYKNKKLICYEIIEFKDKMR
jgi:hypothetical protein